jgi:hypothetical protein
LIVDETSAPRAAPLAPCKRSLHPGFATRVAHANVGGWQAATATPIDRLCVASVARLHTRNARRTAGRRAQLAFRRTVPVTVIQESRITSVEPLTKPAPAESSGG